MSLHDQPRRPLVPKSAITRRQLEALRLAANGNTNAAIARWMGISKNTVTPMLGKAARKLGASDRTQAVAVALRLGLIRMDDVVLPVRPGVPGGDAGGKP